MPPSLPPVVAEYLAAVNAFDADAIVASFAPDAYVNDARREIKGKIVSLAVIYNQPSPY